MPATVAGDVNTSLMANAAVAAAPTPTIPATVAVMVRAFIAASASSASLCENTKAGAAMRRAFGQRHPTPGEWRLTSGGRLGPHASCRNTVLASRVPRLQGALCCPVDLAQL